MRQSVTTVFGLVIALLLVLTPVLGSSAAATAQNGLKNDRTYESPQFDYTVEWGDDWSARGRDVISNRGGYDTLTLRGKVGTLWIQGQGSDVTAADAVQKRIQIEGKESNVVSQDLDSDVPIAEMVVGRDKILIEGYTLDVNQAVVVIVLSARERDFDEALSSVNEQVLFNGGPILTGQAIVEGNGSDVVETPTEASEETPEPTEAPTEAPVGTTPTVEATKEAKKDTSSATDGTYTGTVNDYTLTFSSTVWQVENLIENADSDGIKLLSDTGVLTIWSWDGYGADPVACLDGESGYYAKEDATVEDWAPAEDANGEPIRYEANDYAYGVFTLTYTNPEDGIPSELVDYVECRTIPGADAVVIIFGSSTPEMYNDHLDQVLDVAETITFANEDDSNDKQVTTPPPETEIPATGLSGSLYTSPSFGFTMDIPVQWQVTDEQLMRNDEQIMLTNDTSDVMVWATDSYTGDLAGCVDFAAENAPHSLVLATTAEGKPFRGDDRNGAYGNFLYDDGDEAYSISCQYIEEGESVLIITQDVPASELASQRKFRIDLQQSIEMP